MFIDFVLYTQQCTKSHNSDMTPRDFLVTSPPPHDGTYVPTAGHGLTFPFELPVFETSLCGQFPRYTQVCFFLFLSCQHLRLSEKGRSKTTVSLAYYETTVSLAYYETTVSLAYYETTVSLAYYETTVSLAYYETTVSLAYYETTVSLAYYYDDDDDD